MILVASAVLVISASPARAAAAPARVYVLNSGTTGGIPYPASMSVIDPGSNTVVASVPLSHAQTTPRDLAISPDASRIYVTYGPNRSGFGDVAVIDTSTNNVASVSFPGPSSPPANQGGFDSVAVSPDGAHAYVTNRNSGQVLVIDTATNSAVVAVAVPLAGRISVSPDGGRLYVLGAGGLYAIDTATNAVVAVVPGSMTGLVVAPDGRLIYALDDSNSRVLFIDENTYTVVAAVTVDSPTGGLVVSPDGARIYATSSKGLVVIDTATAAIVTSLPSVRGVRIALSPDGNQVYDLEGQGSPYGDLRIVDISTGLAVADVTVGLFPVAVVSTPAATAAPPSCAPGGGGAGASRPFANLLDADTSTIDRSVGKWVPWFSTSVSQSAAPSQGCGHSLKVDITAPYGWGVQLANFPGFAASPGAHVIGFWGRSANPGLAATMTVTWRNAGQAVLGTDRVTLPLTGRLTHASTVAFAPPGTAFAFVDFTSVSGTAGNTVYLDDISVTPVPSALGADTATLEGGKGEWAPWFSTNVSQSTVQAHGGTHSLKVDVTAPYGWGVQLRNFPGFATGPGAHVIGFWGRSAAPGLSATMAVTWRDASGAVVGTDTVTLPLTDAWTQVSKLAFAPAGTAFADVHVSNASGQPGDTLFLDDISVIAVPSVLGRDTSTIEGPGYRWAPWYSTRVSRSMDQAHTGTSSLKVDVTAPYGWGVQLRNYPGFATSPGPKTIGFWGRSPSAGLAATMTVRWRNESGVPLATNQLPLTLGDSWAQALANVTAPAGTARVTVEFSGPAGPAGSTIYLDDIVVVDANLAVLTPG